MELSVLYLKNFRKYEEGHFAFKSGLNWIVGPNASGKTTVLEALYVLMTGRSFRTAQLGELIRHGADFFYIEASFTKYGLEQTLKFSYDGKERKIFHNHTPISSATALLGLLKGVVVTPDDAALVKGQPALRRHFLDLQIAQCDPLYVHHLTRYARALQQRNTLLRLKKEGGIETWEHELATSAAYLTAQRYRAAEDLAHLGKKMHLSLAGEVFPFELRYKSNAPLAEELLKGHYLDQLKRHRRREMELGFTLTGPHKDDLLIHLDQKEVRHYGSEGQQRTCVAALKLAEWERMKGAGDGVPLMMVDDVGVSLDAVRKKKLLEHLLGLGQVFLTATENN